jgi:hypothetical protein
MEKKSQGCHAMRTLLMVLIGLFCLGGVQSALAQIDQGAITGTITDANGSVIQGASVTLVNQDTNLSFTQKTESNGYFRFSPIKIGLYTLTVTAPGFETRKQENIRVDVSQTVGLNLSLKPGAVSETITVTSSPEIQTEEASTGQVFSTETVNDMPLDGRNYVFVAQLTTGVAAPNQGYRQVAGAGDFTSNGNRVSQNNFVLDGVDNNSNMQDFLNGATYAVRPPPDALAEFKVESSDYSAELGHSTGAAINASIKSGTNKYHATLWEYLENDRMNAADYFDTTGKTSYHQNQFGADIGGPILRDKLFFFADAQGTRISAYNPASSAGARTVPTDLMRKGDFSELLDASNTDGNGTIPLYLVGGNPTATIGGTEAAGVTQRYLTCNGKQNVICNPNSVAETLLKLYPEPNNGAVGQTAHNYTIPATTISNDTTQYDARVDYNPSSKDQIFGRYSYSNNPTVYAPPFGPILDGGGFGTGNDANYAKSAVVGDTHFFSPTLANEFRVGFNYLHAAYLQENSQTDLAAKYGLGGIPFGPSLGGLPSINFGGAGGANGFGTAWYEPSDEKQDVLQINDNLSKVLGKHSLKVGLNFQHVRFYGLQPPQGIGTEDFDSTFTSDPGAPSGQNTGSGLADFLLDDMHDSNLTTLTPFTDLRWYEAVYVQDDWKVTQRLTVNLGLRWEYTQPIRELHNEQANFYGNYVSNNQGTGTFLIPEAQKSFPITPGFLTMLAADNITLQYTSNESLVNPNKLNFAPRLGVSYQVDSKTVVRAGAGIFYGGFENIGLGLNLANNAPFFVSANWYPIPNQCYNLTVGGVTCPTNGQTLETGFGAAATSATALANAAGITGTIYANDQNAKTALTTAYNLSAQRSITDTLSFTIGYQGNMSKHLRMSYSANNYDAAIPKGADTQLLQPFHDFYIVNVANQGLGRYDSLQAKLDKRYSNGIAFTAGYTWSHCLDDAFGPIGQSAYGGYRNPTALGFRYDYGTCTQNVGNRFTFAPQYELPFGKGKKFLNKGGVTDAVIGGWKTSLIFQAQSGNPVFITSTNQGSSYPIRIGDPFATGGTADSATQPNFVCAAKTKTLDQWFNPCAFKNPPQATTGATDPTNNLITASAAGLTPFGPRGRQGVTGPGFNKLDMSLFKNFTLPFHASNLQLRADAFNLLNHPSFGNPGTGLSGGGNQQIGSTRFSGILPDARVIQVAGRLTF